MIEGSVETVGAASTTTATTAAATTGPAFGFTAVGLGVVSFVVFVTFVAVLAGGLAGFARSLTFGFAFGAFRGGLGFGLGVSGFLFGSGGLDLSFDLVAEVYLGGGVDVIVGRKIVLAAELAEFRGAHFELMGDPGIGATLADPGPNLVELWA